MSNRVEKKRAACLVASMILVVGACGDDAEQSDASTAVDEVSDDGSAEPSGPLCADVPSAGDGSFEGMSDDPAATATANNPGLSVLAAAVDRAGLVDTLNGTGPFTIFAPVNAAFAALPAGDLDALLADPDALKDVLSFHVVAGERLSGADLLERDSVETLQGSTLSFDEEAGMLRVDGHASVVCADVHTANSTVHLIDAVLMPNGG